MTWWSWPTFGATLAGIAVLIGFGLVLVLRLMRHVEVAEAVADAERMATIDTIWPVCAECRQGRLHMLVDGKVWCSACGAVDGRAAEVEA